MRKASRNGINTDGWAWKTSDGEIRTHQLRLLQSLLDTTGLSRWAAMAMAGWMLSEMLRDVPLDDQPLVRRNYCASSDGSEQAN